jgi:hypothetical protein
MKRVVPSCVDPAAWEVRARHPATSASELHYLCDEHAAMIDLIYGNRWVKTKRRLTVDREALGVLSE